MRLRNLIPGLLFAALSVAALNRLPAAEEKPASFSPTPLTRDLFLSALTRELASHFNLEGELQLDLIREWAPPARVASAWQVSVLDFPAVPSSSMLVHCRLLADGGVVEDKSVVLRAELLRDAWIARQPLAVGVTFDPALLDTRRVDFFRDRDALPAAVGDRTFIFTRAVNAGGLLTWRDLSRRPLVKKGGLVEVTAIDGLLSITMKALAMENGAQGDTITVRNPESLRNFSAVVVDENRVQVRF